MPKNGKSYKPNDLPMESGSTSSDAVEDGNKISSFLKDAGFERIIIHKKNMKPVSTMCVMGKE
jgi:hypothetical protein